MRKHWILVLSALLIASSANAQRDFSKTNINVTPLGESLHMLEGEGGNTAFWIGDDGVLMVDDQFAELHKRIVIGAIQQLTNRPVEFLLNTHWHGDHTGGNELMHATGTHIVAHENVRKRLSTKQVRKLSGRVSEARPKEALPILTYKKSITFHFNEETIEVVHFGPGHTDGDSVAFFKEANVVHMGDLMFSGRFPFIDLDSGGSVDGYIENVQKILDLIDDNARIIPGHGPLSTKADLEKFLKMLIFSRDLVNSAIAEGIPPEAIKALPFPAEFEGWGSGFINTKSWLGTLYTFYKK